MPHVLVNGLPIPFSPPVRKEVERVNKSGRGLGLTVGDHYRSLDNGRDTPTAERAPGLPVRGDDGTKVRPRCITFL